MMFVLLFLRYSWAVILHKICIFIAGFHLNRTLRSTSYRVSFQRLLLHDLSKFSPSEFWPYAEYFYGKKTKACEEAFHHAWLHHVEHNDHHSEHFIEDYPSIAKRLRDHEEVNDLVMTEMPEDAILEMVTDNLAATRSYEGFWPETKTKDGWKWMSNSFDKFRLHPNTKIKFAAILCAIGYARVLPEEFDWADINRSNMVKEEKIRLFQLQKLAQLNN